MAALETPICDFGWKAPNFLLTGTDSKRYALQNIRGANGTLVMFICNHCPFVLAVIDRIVRDAKELEAYGIGAVAIMSNDVSAYPEDGFEKMQEFCKAHQFNFPYLFDETQEVARDYGAICTPEFFGFNKDMELQYRGRLDASRMETVPDAKRELFEAMKLISQTGKGPREQSSSIGCSIKWK
jgi:peroxiredoxin